MVTSLSWRACQARPAVLALGLFSLFDGKDRGEKVRPLALVTSPPASVAAAVGPPADVHMLVL